MNVLLIGYGSIGKRHEHVLKDLLGNELSLDVVSRHSPRPYKELSDVPDLARYDYFVIASETNRHHEQLALVDRSVHKKKILVEKPLFNKYNDFRSRNNNRIFVGYNLRFHPVLQEIKKSIAGKDITAVTVHAGQYLPDWRPGTDYTKSYSASAARGGGVLLDLSHEIDYVQWLFGTIRDLDGQRTVLEKRSDLRIETEDTAIIVGTTAQGIPVTIELDYISARPVRTLQIRTSTGPLDADLIGNTINGRGSGTLERNVTYTNMHEAVLNRNGVDVCTLEEGLETMHTIDKVRTTAKKDVERP